MFEHWVTIVSIRSIQWDWDAATKEIFGVSLVRAIIAGIAGLYLFIVGTIWYTHARFIFHPSSIVDSTPADLGVRFENVTLPLGSGQLAGWWVPADSGRSQTMLYLHGNAANVAANVHQVVRLRKTGLNIFIFDYRGYGQSTGDELRARLGAQDLDVGG